MLYNIVRAILRFLFILLGLKVEGLENIPPEGPIIIAPNHVSNWDPIMVAVAINRPIHFMAKAELFNYNILGKLLTKVYVFPVKRGSGDRQAIKHALQVLEKGNILGIFPEGTRNKTGQDLNPQSGTAMIALRSKVDIIPVACIGTGRILPMGWFRPLIVRIGKPISLEDYRDKKVNSVYMEEISMKVVNRINSLLYK